MRFDRRFVLFLVDELVLFFKLIVYLKLVKGGVMLREKCINDFCFKLVCEEILFFRYVKKFFYTDVFRDNMDYFGVFFWVKVEFFMVGVL